MAESFLTKPEALKILQRLSPELTGIGVHAIGLFGSVVRDEATETSDVDVLVEFEPGKKTFDSFMDVCFLLDEAFSRKVEVVTKEALSPHIGPHIMKEVEYVSLSS